MTEQSLKADIEDANRLFMELFNAGRVADVAGCYTEDAQFLVPGHEPFVGRAAIAGVLGGLRGDGNRLALETVEVEAGGDFAWESGVVIRPHCALPPFGVYRGPRK